MTSHTDNAALGIALPERVIDTLWQAAGLSTFHPDGDQLEKLHSFAHAITAEVLARIPASPAPAEAPEHELLKMIDDLVTLWVEEGAPVARVSARKRLEDAIRALLHRQPSKGQPVANQEISVDVSTGDDDHDHRIFAKLTGERGSDGTWLAVESSRNFSQPVAGQPAPVAWRMITPEQGNVVFLEDREEAERFKAMGREVRPLVYGDALPAQVAATAQPLFWYRPRSDGGYEGPIHNETIEKVRRDSGVWVPLYPPQVAAVSADVLKDKERLDWLLERGMQVWETRDQYFIHRAFEHYPISDGYATAREAIDAFMSKMPMSPPTSNPNGCRTPIVDDWWNFCGETDMGQTAPVLCTECGGTFARKTPTGKEND
jgi:hypothetical protein